MKGTRLTIALLAALLTASAIAAIAVRIPAATRAVAGVPAAPTGWNSWNAYGCGIDATKVEHAADAMVSSGMRDAGYQYVVIDDCWVAATRDAHGRLRADPTRFPHGIAAVARYVHARGLRFGLYTSATTRTCAQNNGSWPGATGSGGHEALDAATFAAWGVDLVKDDWCSGASLLGTQQAAFSAFRDGIRATGRPIVLMINPNSGVSDSVPGAIQDWTGTATTVRITNDVIDQWSTPGPATASQGIAQAIAAAEAAVDHSWTTLIRPDLDMLWVGHPGLTTAEQRTQLGMVAFLGLPLMSGLNPAHLTGTARMLLTNRAVVQLTTCIGRPRRAADQHQVHIWTRQCGGHEVIAAYNPTGRSVTVDLSPLLGNTITDEWTGTSTDASHLNVAAHDTRLLRTTSRR